MLLTYRSAYALACSEVNLLHTTWKVISVNANVTIYPNRQTNQSVQWKPQSPIPPTTSPSRKSFGVSLLVLSVNQRLFLLESIGGLTIPYQRALHVD